HPRREVPDVLHHGPSGVVIVPEVGIGQARIAALAHTQDRRGALGFLASELGGAARGALAGREIENAGAVSRVRGAEPGAGAGELDVVTVGGDGQDIHGHGHSRTEGWTWERLQE